MEVAAFGPCQQCGGNGKVNGQKCPLCFGYRSYFFDNNNFLYWEKVVSYAHIFIREFKKVINIIINTVLIVGSVFTLVLLYLILDKVQFDPRNFWYFLTQANKENFWFWLLILLDMFLYYRLTYGGQKKKQLSSDLKSVNTYVKHNIADSLSQEVSTMLDKSWLFAKHKKVFPVTAWHLLFVLLSDKDIRLVLARLGVGADNIKTQIDSNLSSLVGQFENQEELTEGVKNAMLNAYFHMNKRHAFSIAEVDLLYGLVMASEQIKNLFYDFDIDEEKIDNVIAWVDINKQLLKRYQTFRSRSFFKPKSGINRAYTAIATPVLNNFSSDLTMAARSGYLPLSVAREKELSEITNTIESSFSSVVLVGPPGVGKTNIVEGLANRMMAEDIPELFQDKRLVSISVPLVISGAGAGGGVEERFLTILHEASASGNIILYFDDIHQLIGVASEGNQGVDLSEVLASEIRSKNILVIASTSNKDYVQYIESSALGQVLKKINISEPNKNQTIQMMEAHVGLAEGKNKVYFTYDALEKIFELSSRYITDISLPKKAIDLMDEVAVMVAKSRRGDNLIKGEDVAQLVSNKTNIPLTQVTTQESSKLLNLEEEIHERIVGQEEAVTMVAAALRRARSELRDLKRPIVNLLFLGPTGVGKTELAKTVAEKYFGNENDMIRLDMSEYQSQSSLPRLIGSPQSSTPGLLTEAVRHKPFALLLLDEIEKANEDILNIFLQVMEDGRLTDALGRTVDFTNLIIVATSNAGTEYIQDQINAGKKVTDFSDDLIKNKLRGIFKPEFLNRFDAVMVFRPLSPEEIFKIAGLMLQKVKKRLAEKGIFFEITEGAQRELAQAGFDPVFGARPLRRVIQEKVDNALADFLLKGQLGRRDIVVYDIGGQIKIKKPIGY